MSSDESLSETLVGSQSSSDIEAPAQEVTEPQNIPPPNVIPAATPVFSRSVDQPSVYRAPWPLSFDDFAKSLADAINSSLEDTELDLLQAELSSDESDSSTSWCTDSDSYFEEEVSHESGYEAGTDTESSSDGGPSDVED